MGGSIRRILADARLTTLVVVLVVTLPVLALGALAVRQSGADLRTQETKHLASAASAAGANERQRLVRLQRRLQGVWAATPAASFADAGATARTLAEVARRAGSDLVGVALADAGGHVIASEPGPFGAAVPPEALRAAEREESLRITPFARLGGRTFYVLSMPVEGAGGKVVLVGMDARSALRDMSGLLGVFGSVYVVDSNGMTLSVARFAQNEDYTGTLDADPDLAACCTVPALGTTGDAGDLFGEATLDNGEWRIVLGQPAAVLQTAIDGIGATLLGIGTIPLLLLVAGAVALSRVFRRTLRQRERMREMQTTARIGGWRWDLRTERLSASRELLRILGLPSRREGIALETLLDRVHPDDRARVRAALAHAAEAGAPTETRCRVTAANGQIFVVEVRSVRETDRRGRRVALRGTLQDVTELYRSEEQRAQLLAQMDSIDEAVIGTTLDGTISDWNACAERLFGYTRDEAVGRSVKMLRPPERRSGSGAMLAAVSAGRRMDRQELDRLRKDGTLVDVAVSGTPVWNAAGEVVAATFTYRDVARQKRLENELAERVSHDALTGLPNRFLLRDRLDQALRGAERSREPLALLEVDIERFRDVNDAIGQQGGDALLMDMAARLQAEVRAVDTVARLGTDVFAVVVPGSDETAAMLVASRIRSALQQPFVLGRHEIDVDISVGVVLAPAHGSDVVTLFRRCEIALQAAKRSRAGYALYASDGEPAKPSRVIVLTELRQALERDELVLEYQPEVDLRTGETARVEALLRWDHPTRGLLAPMEFIPLVEDTGLIAPITQWVLATAMRQCRTWRDAGVEMPIAVNLSSRSLLEPGFVASVGEALGISDTEGPMLTIEITESVLMEDAKRAREVIDELRRLGVRIAIDDFGTGYSSFAYLDTLPIDEMKIDRSFVLGLARERSSAIVGSMIDLGHHLGIEVVAEGVETEEAAAHLTELGCDTLQGFSIGRPMSARALEDWLRARPAPIAPRARATRVRRVPWRASGGAPAA